VSAEFRLVDRLDEAVLLILCLTAGPSRSLFPENCSNLVGTCGGIHAAIFILSRTVSVLLSGSLALRVEISIRLGKRSVIAIFLRLGSMSK
jgi:hypothetical protein